MEVISGPTNDKIDEINRNIEINAISEEFIIDFDVKLILLCASINLLYNLCFLSCCISESNM